MDLYAENILDHYRHPRGKKEGATGHSETNPTCGDELIINIKDRSWSGVGCAISQAAMSMLFEEMEEMSDEDIEKLSKQDIFDMLGVPIGSRRTKCALLCLHTLKNALRKSRGEEPQTWIETVEIR